MPLALNHHLFLPKHTPRMSLSLSSPEMVCSAKKCRILTIEDQTWRWSNFPFPCCTQYFWTAEYDIKVGSISLAELSLRRSLFLL